MSRVSKPGSTLLSVVKLLSRRPAPTRRTSAAAVWVSTRASRPRPTFPTDPDCRSPPTIRLRDAWTAGRSPNATAAPTERSTVKSIAIPSRRADARLGMFSGAAATSAGRPSDAMRTPRRPPPVARTSASAIWRRISPPRPAPSARRTPRSSSRPSARARKRLATLAHAISSTTPTVPKSSQSGCVKSPTSASSSVRTTGRCCSMISTYWGGPPNRSGRRDASTPSWSARASTDTPGLVRPTISNPKSPGWISDGSPSAW